MQVPQNLEGMRFRNHLNEVTCKTEYEAMSTLTVCELNSVNCLCQQYPRNFRNLGHMEAVIID